MHDAKLRVNLFKKGGRRVKISSIGCKLLYEIHPCLKQGSFMHDNCDKSIGLPPLGLQLFKYCIKIALQVRNPKARLFSCCFAINKFKFYPLHGPLLPNKTRLVDTSFKG
jgi:hypothetical protein